MFLNANNKRILQMKNEEKAKEKINNSTKKYKNGWMMKYLIK